MSGETCKHDNTAVAVLENRVTNVEKVMESIDESLKKLVALEIRHEETKNGLGRAFSEIEKQGNRLTTIEGEMPTLKMVRGWVIAGVIGILSILGVQLTTLLTTQAHAIEQQVSHGSSK